LGFCKSIFSVKAPYQGPISNTFFQVISRVEAIVPSIFSSTKKFCPRDFLALIQYFANISKLIYLKL
jgi:hypothetical protein